MSTWTQEDATRFFLSGENSGGDPLSLTQLDEAVDGCIEPTRIIANKTMVKVLSTALTFDSPDKQRLFDLIDAYKGVLDIDVIAKIVSENFSGDTT